MLLRYDLTDQSADKNDQFYVAKLNNYLQMLCLI